MHRIAGLQAENDLSDLIIIVIEKIKVPFIVEIHKVGIAPEYQGIGM
jgi:hypothetical protein